MARRVLVVDDEPDICALYRLDLQDVGYEVMTAADAAEALRLVHEWQPDLVLLDIRLGNDNGLDLLRRISDVRPGIVTVLVSGYARYHDDGSSWFADAFLTKSVDTSELIRTVQELLAARTVH